jgi:hypothetical protein
MKLEVSGHRLGKDIRSLNQNSKHEPSDYKAEMLFIAMKHSANNIIKMINRKSDCKFVRVADFELHPLKGSLI